MPEDPDIYIYTKLINFIVVAYSYRKRIFRIFNFKYKSLFIILIATLSSLNFKAQNPCNSNVPFYVVDLTGNPNGTWISPSIKRSGLCCSATNPDKCISFLVILDSNSVGLKFYIASGAIPPGSLYYQIDCSTPQPVGHIICLPPPGPYYLTFCKPGNNENTYAVQSISKPLVSANIVTTLGCTKNLWVTGLIPSTIVWNDITYNGTYNSYLSCQSGCPTTNITPTQGFPPFVDYQVCGVIADSCQYTNYFCDTIRVYFVSQIDAIINPNPASFCEGETGVLLNAIANGGAPPFTYLWTDMPGGNGNIYSDSSTFFATSPGTYYLNVTDSLYPGCPSQNTSITVTKYPKPEITVIPTDTVTCLGNPVNLIANGADNYVWGPNTGLSDTTGNNVVANPTTSTTYTIIGINNSGGCSDTITSTINVLPLPSINYTTNNVHCYNENNGEIYLNISDGNPPYSYLWGNGATNHSLTNLAAGSYNVTVTDNNNCNNTANINITQPDLLSIIINVTNVSCFNGNDGSATVNATGGTPPYTY
ncbi:MAG TPA: SprB repeat-containing protein, partial [Bacteroidales bacterium]|nr:SprB repeat-containing protein [Bacteroidales bacterium]